MDARRNNASTNDKAVWEKLYAHPLSSSELLEIRENWTRFAKILVQQSWELRNDPAWSRRLHATQGGVA